MQLSKNFNLSEFTKNGNDLPLELLPNVLELAKNMQVLRDVLGVPILVNSGYRRPEYNKQIGGVKNSFHMKGMACDFHVSGVSPLQLKNIIEGLILNGKMKEGGLGLYPTFIHYDIQGVKRRWNG